MTVPSSGQISIKGLASEKKNGTYDETATIADPISLYDLVMGGNARGSGESYDITNTASPSYPDEVAPHSMSEWYSYNHDAGLSCSSLTSISLYPQISQNCDTSKPPITFYIDNGSTWATTNNLYRDNAGNCILANAGWYYCGSCSQNGTELRYWDGNSFTSTTGCP